MLKNGKARSLLIGLVSMSACSFAHQPAALPRDDVRNILTLLRDSLPQLGVASRIVNAPARHGAPRPDSVFSILQEMLRLPLVHAPAGGAVCQGPLKDGEMRGADLRVPEFAVINDSARVTLERSCLQRANGQERGFTTGITWTLRRTEAGWHVVQSMQGMS